MADEFFEDEVEAMEEAAAPVAADTAASAGASRTADAAPAPAGASRTAGAASVDTASETPAGTGYVRTPPPFWMVLAIAAIALLLGVVIGYLAGSASTMQAISAEQAAAQQASAGDDSDYSLPEGHPEVSIDEDGTAHVAGSSD